MKNSTCILLICLFISCSRPNTLTVRNVQELLKDSIVLNDLNSDAELSYGQNEQGHLTIGFLSPKRNKLYSYDANNAQIDTIEINPGNTRREFYLSKDTTLYILNGRENYIAILKDGQYSYAYATQNDSLPATLYSMFMPFQVVNKHVLLQKTLYYDIRTKAGLKAMLSSEMLRLFRIERDSLIEVASLGAFPEEYIKRFYYEVFPKAAYSDKLQRIYYLFNNSNIIYEYDITTAETHPHTVTGLKKNNQIPFDQNKISDLSYVQNYQLENSQYYMILYDNIHNKLVVFQAVGIPLTNAKGELNLFTDQPYLIYVINSQYEVEKIFRFENYKNHKFPFAYCSGGSLFVPARDVKFIKGKNQLTVYVYKIS